MPLRSSFRCGWVLLALCLWFGQGWQQARSFVEKPLSPLRLPAKGTIEVAFSPQGGATAAIVRALEEARQKVLVQAYSFTSAPIAKALVLAHRRGVDVRVILDSRQTRSNIRYNPAVFLSDNGIPVRLDAAHAIAHNKVLVIDDKTVVTGSFNFTKAAEEKNAENLLILRENPDLAALYRQNWEYHWDHSEDFRAQTLAPPRSWQAVPSPLLDTSDEAP